MTGSSPRDFREWMRMMERGMGEGRRAAYSIGTTVTEVIRDEIATDAARHPTFPIELVYQTALYLDTSGRTRTRFLLDFPDVSFATDGTAIPIREYELWAKEETSGILALSTSAVPGLAVPGLTLPGLANTPSSAAIDAQPKQWELVKTNPASYFRAENFIPGTVWRFKVRAMGLHTVLPGSWSEEIVVQMLKDTTPPGQPTAPVITADRGTLTATWDGMSVSGTMPADFKYAILAHGTDSSPINEIARFGRGGGFKIVVPEHYYDPQFFRLQAVDESGNLSPWSEQGVGYTTPLVDRDVILSTIDAAKTHLKNINAGVSILPHTIITEHLVVTEDMTAAIANFLTVNVDMLNANQIWADTIWFGLADGALVRADMFEGKAFHGGEFTTDAGGKFQTNVEDLVGIKLTETSLKAWSGSGVETFILDATTGALSVLGGSITGATIQTALSGRRIKLDIDGVTGYDASGNVVLTQDTTTGDMVMRGNILSRAMGGNSLWLGADMTESGATGVPAKPGLVFGATTSETQSAALYRDGTYGALRLDSPYSNNTVTTARSVLMASNSGLFAWAWRASQTAGPGVSDTQKLYLGTDDAWFIGGGQPGSTTDNRVQGFTDSSLAVRRNDNHQLLFESDRSTYLDTSRLDINGPIYATAKSFRIPHPLLPGKDLVHGSTESPMAGVEYWGSGVLDGTGKATVALPSYFEALCKPENRAVLVSASGSAYAISASVIADGAFTVSGTAGKKFAWLVKAERFGADFDTVQDAMSPPKRPAVQHMADQSVEDPEEGYPMPFLAEAGS